MIIDMLIFHRVPITDGYLLGDSCRCNIVTLEKQIDGTNSEIFYASFSNEVCIH